jgi:hypothetical protein
MREGKIRLSAAQVKRQMSRRDAENSEIKDGKDYSKVIFATRG